MKIVLDTNVIVSALINPYGIPARVFSLVETNAVTAYCDVRILEEYRKVLSRPRFNFSQEMVDGVLLHFEGDQLLTSVQPLTNSLPDVHDNAFLEVALHIGADYLITGNLNHFPPDKCAPIVVVSPREFLSAYLNN